MIFWSVFSWREEQDIRGFGKTKKKKRSEILKKWEYHRA